MRSLEKRFADLEYESKKHKTGRQIFLERMEEVIVWEKLLEAIKTCYPQSGKGRAPCPLENMLRVHCVQLFCNLSDPAMEICSLKTLPSNFSENQYQSIFALFLI